MLQVIRLQILKRIQLPLIEALGRKYLSSPLGASQDRCLREQQIQAGALEAPCQCKLSEHTVSAVALVRHLDERVELQLELDQPQYLSRC